MNISICMNESAEEFYSWIDRRPLEDDEDDERKETVEEDLKKDAQKDDKLHKFPQHDESSVSRTDSDDSDSVSEAESVHCVAEYAERDTKPGRRISFDCLEIREYAQTIGDHPYCKGGLPLTLDWHHTEETLQIPLDDYCSERLGAYQMPTRLSYDERRGRLLEVSMHNEETDARHEEVGLVMDFLTTSWTEHAILPPPMFEELPGLYDDDDENENEGEEVMEKQTEQLERYHHYLSQSSNFLD